MTHHGTPLKHMGTDVDRSGRRLDTVALLRRVARPGKPGVLSTDTEVTFVGAEVRDEPLAPTELVVTLTTAAPAREAQVANLRTIRDLRRAVREVRLGAALVDQSLALAA